MKPDNSKRDGLIWSREKNNTREKDRKTAKYDLNQQTWQFSDCYFLYPCCISSIIKTWRIFCKQTCHILHNDGRWAQQEQSHLRGIKRLSPFYEACFIVRVDLFICHLLSLMNYHGMRFYCCTWQCGMIIGFKAHFPFLTSEGRQHKTQLNFNSKLTSVGLL